MDPRCPLNELDQRSLIPLYQSGVFCATVEREAVKHQATVQLKGFQEEESETHTLFSLAFDP